MKPTCKELILQSVSDGKHLAVHEMGAWMRYRGHCHSESSISARQRELAQERKLIGRRREGKSFKEWALPGQGILFNAQR